jgi:hypothetical protein
MNAVVGAMTSVVGSALGSVPFKTADLLAMRRVVALTRCRKPSVQLRVFPDGSSKEKGFDDAREQRLLAMLAFHDVHEA